MIVVTGAAGKTGTAVIRALARRGQAVRALVHRAEQREVILRAGASEAQAGDLHDAASLRQALQGAVAVYHLCPNMHPDELAIGRQIIEAAQGAGVNHFVYHSVLHPQVEAMPHHWHKLRVEELLLASALPYTILQPTAYMQNLRANWPRMQNEGILANPYPPETRLSLVDVADVGEAAAVVLTEPGHQGAIYELCGTGPMSQHEVAGILAGVLGLPIRAELIPLDEWEQSARQTGLSDYALTILRQMFEHYATYGLMGNPNVLRWLLGRKPTTVSEFARRSIANA
jgi:NAD(P)H dehydrogenase (quinone)